MNSDNKKFSDFYSRIPSKKKKKYVDEQQDFLKKTQSNEIKIKKDSIDFGDAIEIECYGYCIREFHLLNVLNLFCKNTWYNEENYKKFKENYINRSKIAQDNSDEAINIQSYIKKNELLSVFFESFKIDDSEIQSKNILLFKRKKEFVNDDDNGNPIFKRELCTTPHTHPSPDDCN